jgi:hypothetical protein
MGSIGIPSRPIDIEPQRPLDFLFHDGEKEQGRRKRKERRKETHRNMHGEFGNEISHKTDISLEARRILDTRAKHHVFMHHDNEK